MQHTTDGFMVDFTCGFVIFISVPLKSLGKIFLQSWGIPCNLSSWGIPCNFSFALNYIVHIFYFQLRQMRKIWGKILTKKRRKRTFLQESSNQPILTCLVSSILTNTLSEMCTCSRSLLHFYWKYSTTLVLMK